MDLNENVVRLLIKGEIKSERVNGGGGRDSKQETADTETSGSEKHDQGEIDALCV